MAIYHYAAQIIGRSSGRSAVAAAAYRAGEMIVNQYDGVTHDFTRRAGVVYSRILAPENVPVWVEDRSKLWNAVEQAEKRKDAQLAREINVALPREITRDQQIDLLNGYIQDTFTARGMIADAVIHDKGDGNPHAHIMLTMRDISPEGFGLKNRSWNPEFASHQDAHLLKDTEGLVDWRAAWADHANRALERVGADDRIDHRSYAEQGVSTVPTVHEGHWRPDEIVQRNEDARTMNEELAQLQEQLKLVEQQIASEISPDLSNNVGNAFEDLCKVLPLRGPLTFKELPIDVQKLINDIGNVILQKTEASANLQLMQYAWTDNEKRLNTSLSERRDVAFRDLKERMRKLIIDAAANANTQRSRAAAVRLKEPILNRAMIYSVTPGVNAAVLKLIQKNAGKVATGELLSQAAQKMRGARLRMERTVRCAIAAGAERGQVTKKIKEWLGHEYARIEDIARIAAGELKMSEKNVAEHFYRGLGYGQPGELATDHDAKVFFADAEERDFDYQDMAEVEQEFKPAVTGDAAPATEDSARISGAAANELIRTLSALLDQERKQAAQWGEVAWEHMNAKKKKGKGYEQER